MARARSEQPTLPAGQRGAAGAPLSSSSGAGQRPAPLAAPRAVERRAGARLSALLGMLADRRTLGLRFRPRRRRARAQGGNARTMLIVNCSPCADNAPETLSSLRFGSRALGIKNAVAVNRRLSPEALQRQLDEARAQVGRPTGRGREGRAAADRGMARLPLLLKPWGTPS
jgi:hypothetical protein